MSRASNRNVTPVSGKGGTPAAPVVPNGGAAALSRAAPGSASAGAMLSVIVPVYNRASFLGDALASLFAQTHRDFELILVDDGSTDDSVAIARAFGDPRLRVVSHERNRGIPAARNTGLAAAQRDYIAWLDSDDIARADRLARQLAFLRANPDIALVGSCAGKIRKDGSKRRGTRVPPLAPCDIAAWLLFRSAFQQSSVMGRADILKAHPYRGEFDVCEDLDVFVRLARNHRLANLPALLVDRRLHPDQTVRRRQARIRERKALLYAAPLAELGMDCTPDNLTRHTMLGKTKLEGVALPADQLDWADGWLRTMQERNRATHRLDPQGLALAASWFWLLACRTAAPSVGHGKAARAFLTSPLSKGLFAPHARDWLAQALPLLAGLRR